LRQGMSAAKALALLCGHAGSDFGRACVRLDREGHQEMRQEPGLDHLWVLAWRCGEPGWAYLERQRSPTPREQPKDRRACHFRWTGRPLSKACAHISGALPHGALLERDETGTWLQNMRQSFGMHRPGKRAQALTPADATGHCFSLPLSQTWKRRSRR
jgi:hypothetical protein